MPVAEIITIGTELLLGEIQDTNTRFLARALRDLGVDLYRTTTVGDNPARITCAIMESLERCEVVLTTGGLGPTVDDPTRQAVADALGVELEYHPELWSQIEERFRRYGRRKASNNNRRQAYIPSGATPLENPVGTAPAFIAERDGRLVICLPGVPREMETLYREQVGPYLKQHFKLNAIIKARVLHVTSIGESQVDELIGDLEEGSNPTVGLLAGPGRVDIRITVKGESQEVVTGMLASTEAIIREKLGDVIYGADERTLEEATLEALQCRNQSALLVLNGFGDGLATRLEGSQRVEIQVNGEILDNNDKEMQWQETRRLPVSFILLATLTPGQDAQRLEMIMKTPSGEKRLSHSYGGPPEMAPAWAETTCLDHIRRMTLITRG